VLTSVRRERWLRARVKSGAWPPGPASGDQHVADLPILVNRPIQVDPASGDFDIDTHAGKLSSCGGFGGRPGACFVVGVLVWRQCQSLDSSLLARLRSAALWVSPAALWWS